jgi:D-alanyl-D-alanine carboxypeptidase (penicillin-binding protein 5/6)
MKIYLLLLLLIIPINIYALELNSKAYILYDENTNKVILEHNSNEKRSIASLTKMMSTIVAIENNPDLTKKVTITQEMLNTVPWDAAVIKLKAGDVLTMEDLIYATLLPSGADAVNSLAIATAGDLPSFVKLMNDKAKELGMNNTSFENPIGMDHENNYSTASDLYILLKYVLQNNTFKKMFETKDYTMSNGMQVSATAKTFGDQINIDTSRIIGDKTGFTDPAEFCLAFEFVSHDHLFYAVLLGAPVENFTDFKHLRDAVSIINYLDNEFDYYTLVKNNTLYKDIKVVDSTIDNYSIYNDKDLILLLNNYDQSKIRIEDNLPLEISYKNNKDEVIGNIKYYYEDDLIYERTVTLDEVIKPNLKNWIKIHIFELVVLVIIFILLLIIITYWIKRKK